MREPAFYTEYHPKWYRKRVSTYWWSRQWSYFRFILRELTSVSVAYFVVLTLLLLFALSRGERRYGEFLEWLRSPLMIALNAIALAFVLFHTITWFNLAPRAVPVWVRGKRLPDLLITAPNYVAWLAISAVVAWVVLRG